jgi:hypothetical protein
LNVPAQRRMAWFIANSTNMNVRGNDPTNSDSAAVELYNTWTV